MRNILLVDDNPEIVNLLRTILAQPGCRFITGRNGQDALDQLAEADVLPDVIISNYHMPKMDGMDLLEEVRKNPQFQHIPFVMLTAAPGLEWQVRATALGANAFLPKPFRVDLLRQTIKDVAALAP
jgi:CheY-like chemotaxis protein